MYKQPSLQHAMNFSRVTASGSTVLARTRTKASVPMRACGPRRVSMLVRASERCEAPAPGPMVRALDAARTTYSPWKVKLSTTSTDGRKYPELQKVPWVIDARKSSRSRLVCSRHWAGCHCQNPAWRVSQHCPLFAIQAAVATHRLCCWGRGLASRLHAWLMSAGHHQAQLLLKCRQLPWRYARWFKAAFGEPVVNILSAYYGQDVLFQLTRSNIQALGIPDFSISVVIDAEMDETEEIACGEGKDRAVMKSVDSTIFSPLITTAVHASCAQACDYATLRAPNNADLTVMEMLLCKAAATWILNSGV
eukprot:GHUV01055525.1.p1 GENE.GHUV01055525.1~~GHUV01055525.1.p1  ORF type:complete len:307 (+),score=19.70 GHUV01055525.1:81-1001(+)